MNGRCKFLHGPTGFQHPMTFVPTFVPLAGGIIFQHVSIFVVVCVLTGVNDDARVAVAIVGSDGTNQRPLYGS